MNEKINLQDLINLLQRQPNMEQTDADAFVRAFWETIEEGLLSDGIVKVKGLGTFKLVGVESRESINVNTGERFEIRQHSKITFMADSSMRNIINKPFAHFESVILNEETVFDDIEENIIGEPDSDTQQSSNSTDEALSEADTEVLLVSECESSNSVISEKTESVPSDSAHPEIVRTENDEVHGGGNGAFLQEPTISTKSVDSTKVSVSIEDSENMSMSEFQQSSDSEQTSSAEDITPLDKLENEMAGDKSEECIYEDKADVSIHSQMSNECVMHSAKQTSRKALLFAVIALLFFVIFGYSVLHYNKYGKSNHEGQEKSELVDNLVAEKESKEEFAVLADMTNNEVAFSSVSEDDRQGASVGSSDEKSVSDVKEKNLGSDKIRPDENKQGSVTTQRVLTTRVKGQETLADTVEYEIVGVLGQEKIRPGDTLAKFAFKYYGNRRLWQYIALYNKSVVKNPNNVPIGTVLEIPQLELKQR